MDNMKKHVEKLQIYFVHNIRERKPQTKRCEYEQFIPMEYTCWQLVRTSDGCRDLVSKARDFMIRAPNGTKEILCHVF
jgi:hypothetical protein